MTTDPGDDIVVVRPLLPRRDLLGEVIQEVLDSHILTNDGPRVRRLESLLSTELGVTDLAVTASGTTAIQLACAALEITGEVLVPAAAFPAVPQAVLRAGATPVAVDIEETYLTVDPEAVRAAITSRTSAILAVHTFGCPADVDQLRAIADDAGIPLVCDGAPCWGISYRRRPLLRYGDVSTLSLHATKLTHSIEGGAVLGLTRKVAGIVRRLRNFGAGTTDAVASGTNARMSELHAAVGSLVLAEADEEIKRRSAVRGLYHEALADFEWLRLTDFRPDAGPAVAALPVRLADDAPVDAEALCRALLANRIHARAYFAGRYRIRSLRKAGPTPRADRAAGRVVCLPFWGGLSEAQIGRIVEALRAVGRRPALAG